MLAAECKFQQPRNNIRINGNSHINRLGVEYMYTRVCYLIQEYNNSMPANIIEMYQTTTTKTTTRHCTLIFIDLIGALDYYSVTMTTHTIVTKVICWNAINLKLPITIQVVMFIGF